MPRCIANAYLSHKGKIIKPGQEIELTEKQIERLGEKVTQFETEQETDLGSESEQGEDQEQEETANAADEQSYTESDLKSLSADEQKAIVTELGGDPEELTNAEKRINFILENQ